MPDERQKAGEPLVTDSSIPIDLRNPGQVLACLGFLEAAELYCGNAEGWFNWRDASDTRFCLRTDVEANPFALVLDAITASDITCYAPCGYSEADEPGDAETCGIPGELLARPSILLSDSFPSGKGNPMELPIILKAAEQPALELSHWTDGSSRETFKLYSGNRSAFGIAKSMLSGTRHKPKRGQSIGDVKTKGVSQLWLEQRTALLEHPFDVVTPMGGSFNLDPRGAWTAIDAGYSPNAQKHQVAASPIVELFAAIGLEHARPYVYGVRKVQYVVWGCPLPAMMARPVMSGGIPALPHRRFGFELALSGKNKVVTFSEEEIVP
ncbi:type I-U CRISPR-associated protein Cas8c [uncultured Thiodictyon sp.]|uniref:type I-G CRISPR-associated protein Cas8g2 n=1 Tax=uncultured Thiodictyon sp. TaxID=1846217 RepID=UPI0025F9DA5E|nr:type I-U CRISPR-associated protein Cas8c [uncultured Thiodictyon sp.]